MEPPSRFPVFFELSSPPDADLKKKIHNYFHIRRKSGGGECDAVTHAHDTRYCVSFKEQEAQQRVLERRRHVLDCAGGPVVLTVCDGADLPGSASSSATGGQISSQRPQDSTSTTPPSGEEYELQPDAYLLQYFKELELESEFTARGCTAQLLPEEGRVLVRRSAGPGAEGRSLKGEVDALFEGYLCHYEVDPRKVKALLQPCSSNQSPPGGVKVYSEVGMAVVVGKSAHVQARLRDVEDSAAQLRRSHSSENQTSSVHRLSEAKLRLLWGAIESGLGRSFPGVKVTQGDPGQVKLEGSLRDVVQAREWILAKEKEVLEKTVPNMSPHLLAFLKKTYGGPGQLRDLLGVSDEVEAELQDTELRLLSLSPDKLDEPANKTQAEFAEIKIDLSSCLPAPHQLWEKLKSKKSELNQGSCRVQLLRTDQTVRLLGHKAEVEELNDTVTQFVLDQANIQGKVRVQFPELVQQLPELLRLHAFDHSGVAFHPLTSSTLLVGLEGPSSKVAEFQSRLRPFLDSLVQRSVTVDLPGAVRYFQSPPGRQSIRNAAQSQKCLLKLPEQPLAGQSTASTASPGNAGTATAVHTLRNGFQLVVSHGDITKVAADVLVNAANEALRHEGGVAAALSKAGGPEVQRESDMLVKQIGKIPTGNVVVTTGGRLRCKALLHAVGPVAGTVGGREKALLEQVVRSALQMADDMELESVAMPCISSGLFGVPVAVCADAIVTATKDFSAQSLKTVTVIDNRPEVVRALQGACDRLLPGSRATAGPPNPQGLAAGAAPATRARPPGGVDVDIVLGTIETQQVDGLACPMVGHDILSSRVGNTLVNLVGPQLAAEFQRQAGGVTAPGDIVQVHGLSAPHKSLIFLNLLPWDDNQNGRAVQALRRAVGQTLAACAARGLASVALPVLGTGAALRFPHAVAARVILEEAVAFEQGRAGAPPFLVRVVVHPTDKESGKAFESTQQNLRVRGFTNRLNQDQSQASTAQASFYRHVSATNDAVAAMLDRVQLQLVFGNIVNEGTDVIVNTTDFTNHTAGVSNAILTAAGQSVQDELKAVGVPAGFIYTSKPGLLSCREIIHAGFKNDPHVIQKNCKKVLGQCEKKRYHSVAFPAVNTGAAGMAPAQASKAMLDGMAAAIRDLKPNSLQLIRIVIVQQPVFQAFRSELESRYGQAAPSQLTLIEKGKQLLKKLQEKCSKASTPAAAQRGGGGALTAPKPPPAVLDVICRGPDAAEAVRRDLEGALLPQLMEREFSARDVTALDHMQLQALLAKVRAAGMSLESRRNQGQQSAGGGQEVYLLRGLKEDVLSASELINRAVQDALRQDMQEKQEALTALSAQWSVQGADQVWQELSLRDNFLLEDARVNNRVSAEVTAPNGAALKVNLSALQGTDWTSGGVYKVKRNEAGPASELPLQWEPMKDQVFQKFELQPNSQEYKTVADGFLKTAKYNIRKIERVQNLHLWQAYAVCRQRILLKNGAAELGEKCLYHGTSAASCAVIEKDRFDRNYAGAHGALHGKGVYFAVNAVYSAGSFSPADAGGLKRLYAARVLTGRYTVGTSSMSTPPPRGSDPSDRFDSLVDRQQNPSMFVVFHDDQAYPEYCITFS